MAQALTILCVLALLVPLWWRLSRDFIGGLTYAVFLCVSMSTLLRIPMPGALPQLTIFRLILISVFIFWVRERRLGHASIPAPLGKCFWFWGLANLTSLLLASGDFVTSLKRFLDFVVEVWGFWLLVTTSVQNREDGLRILRAAVAGVGFVALLAFAEKYTGFNPVYYLLPDEDETVSRRDVTATYQHRILLGTAMAMVWPLALALAGRAQERRRRFLLWALVGIILGACYFAQSRGPWLAAALGGAVLFVLAGPRVRRQLVWVPVVAGLLLLSRPGVWGTITDKAQATVDKTSFKGGTFRYRLELWRVAWSQVSESPIRVLFGYGPGYGLKADLDWDLSYRNYEFQVTSWDNQYAYELFQSGVIGLAALVTLYFSVAYRLFRLCREAEGAEREMLAALLASVVALVFMLSNVLVYVKQVNFLFWTVAAVGLSYRFPARDTEEMATADEPGAGCEYPSAAASTTS